MTTMPLKIPDEWSNSCLVDNLKHHLATVKLSKSKENTDLLDIENDKFNSYFCLISNRHYVNQAFHYLKIGVLDQFQNFEFPFQIFAKIG